MFSRDLRCLRNTIHANLFLTYILTALLWLIPLALGVSTDEICIVFLNFSPFSTNTFNFLFFFEMLKCAPSYPSCGFNVISKKRKTVRLHDYLFNQWYTMCLSIIRTFAIAKHNVKYPGKINKLTKHLQTKFCFCIEYGGAQFVHFF